MTVASASTSRCQKREAEKRGPKTTREPWISAWTKVFSALVWKSGSEV